MARLKGLEPLTLCLEGRCSIRLSYKRIRYKRDTGAGDGNRTHATSLEGWGSATELHPQIFVCPHAARVMISHLRYCVKHLKTLKIRLCGRVYDLLKLYCLFSLENFIDYDILQVL